MNVIVENYVFKYITNRTFDEHMAVQPHSSVMLGRRRFIYSVDK